MKLTKKRPKTEIEQFREFVKGKKKYTVGSNGKGEIVSCESSNKEIITWLKEKGFNES